MSIIIPSSRRLPCGHAHVVVTEKSDGYPIRRRCRICHIKHVGVVRAKHNAGVSYMVIDWKTDEPSPAS